MVNVCADLSDIEYEILKKIDIVVGEDGGKLRNLLRYYISTIPSLKSYDYALKRVEHKKEIDELKENVMDAYESTDNPMEKWNEEKIEKLTDELADINVLVRTDGNYIPGNKFRGLFKMLLHDIATESMDMDEYEAAVEATIQLLLEFGEGSLSKEMIHDGTIYIDEGWMFAYATAMKHAREFKKTKKIFFSETEIAESFTAI